MVLQRNLLESLNIDPYGLLHVGFLEVALVCFKFLSSSSSLSKDCISPMAVIAVLQIEHYKASDGLGMELSSNTHIANNNRGG